MANDEFKEKEAALRRKADALEESGGDPAKVAELRSQAPAHRSMKPLTTAEQSPKEHDEKADPEDSIAAVDAKTDAKDKVTDEAKPVRGRPRMSATRGDGK